MEFDPLRICRVVLRRDEDGNPTETWVDPRALDENGRILSGLGVNARGEPTVRFGSPMARAAGESCWPERFPEEAVEKLKLEKGAYAWDCNPGEAPILMADLSLKPLAEIKIGDEIVGFETDTSPRREGERFRRRRLVKTKVTDIHKAVRPVVKVLLDSGRIIRCTPNHKWFTGRSKQEKKSVYRPATVGVPLMRICDPELPEVETLEEARMAGWLRGFFDGEGTVSILIRHVKDDEDAPTAIISFAQTIERNQHLCDELERVLDHFGFKWGVAIKRPDSSNPLRMYWLRRAGLPTYQKFLHLTRTEKWKDRIIASALGSSFIKAEERVMSIQPDGEDTVYGLTTETGNYVAWGLASSNSQYQQIPGVRGGAIIKREWWRLWSDKEYPPLGTVVVSLDTAIEEKESADWNACTAWGAFAGHSGEPLFLMLAAWRIRAPLADLVRLVAETCRERKADYLLVEHKTRGRDVSNEIRRLYGNSSWETVLVKPEGDKVSRLKAVEHLFSGDARKMPDGFDAEGKPKFRIDWSGGVVYAPDKDWADEVISECASFPYGAHDDFCDTVAQALGWCRKNGVVLRKAEYDDDELERTRFRKPVGVPYAIR
jgi:phage terminase large subunit-like protein